jgi:hypothetical protein
MQCDAQAAEASIKLMRLLLRSGRMKFEQCATWRHIKSVCPASIS